MRLIINGYEIELYESERLKQTKQANDIGDLNSRQSNFTNKIKVPGTPNNVRAFNFLSIPGNQSDVPYQKNETYLWGDDEELLIYKGWAVPKKHSGTDYEVYIYDGIIDFFKAIENRTLTDIGIAGLNHLKNLDTVIETWTDDTKPYRYNVADYNGKMTYDIFNLNIDYLIPSAQVKYLWDKLFEFIGWTYEGIAFDDEDFTNLWMSYPKSIGDETQQTLDVHVWNFNGAPSYYADSFFGMYLYSNVLTHNPVGNNTYIKSSEQITKQPPDGQIITIKEDGLYKFILSGNILMAPGSTYLGNFDIILQTLVDGEPVFNRIVENIEQGEMMNKVFYINLVAGQSFILYPAAAGLAYPTTIIGIQRVVGNLSIDFDVVTGNNVDFEEAFIGMSVTDFVREVMVRMSLTPFPDAFNKKIRFLKHAEIVNSENPEDWSDKFKSRIGEEYIYGSYGQKNQFAYKYNDKEGDHKDGYLYIANVNLPAERKSHQSAFYAPEKSKTSVLGHLVNVYKFWEKEVKDDGTLKYKELNGRFYLMKSKVKTAALTVGSEQFQQDINVTEFPVEDYSGLNYNEVITKYYPTIYAILNRTKIQDHLINLTATDIENIDFSTPKFIEEEGAYFILNKVKSFESGKLSVCEMIRLEKSESRSNVIQPEPEISLTSGTNAPNGFTSFNWSISNNYQFLNYVPVDGCTIKAIQLDASPYESGVPTGIEINSEINEESGNFTIDLPIVLTENDCGWWRLQITDPNKGLVSNEQIVYVPCPETGGGDPNIYITISQDPNDMTTGSPIIRNVSYLFERFTPTSGVFTCQAHNYITGVPQGAKSTFVLADFSPGTHFFDIEFNQGIGYYKIELITNEISETSYTFVF